MPKRIRSHQLEDLSRRRFRELMPDAWVVRDRSHDYGVDFEVEVYSSDGEATGLVFLAQLKATDSAVSADRVRMTSDQLTYLHSLDAPAAIFRFASPDNSWRWSWTFDPNVVRADDSGKTTTIRFSTDQAWRQDDSARIEATLKVHRALRSPSPRDRVALVCSEGTPKRKQFEIDVALRSIADDIDFFTLERSQDVALKIEVGAEGDQLLIALDRVASGKVPIADQSGLKAPLLYGLISVLRGANLHAQAEMAARAVLRQGLTTTLRSLAGHAAASLITDPIAAADLAVVNGLAERHDPVWVLTLHQLITAPAPRDQRRAGIERFSAAALEAARRSGDPRAEAAVRYNMANGCLDADDRHGGIRHLNAARRLRPAYMGSAYFLTDIGRALYGDARYRKAAVFYRLAHDLEPGPGSKHRLADALMLGGRFAEAHTLYMQLHDEVDEASIAEIILKAALCSALQEELEMAVAPAGVAAGEAWNTVATEDALMNEDDLLRTLRTDDVFNSLANFNLGLLRAKAGRHEEAIISFLACAFRRSGDIEAWRNAVLTSIHLRDAVLAAAVIDCALRMGGLAVRDAVREEVGAQAACDEQVVTWDSILTAAHERIDKTGKGVLFRMISDDDGEPPLTFSLR